MRGRGRGASRRTATLCSRCGELGWETERQARAELQRLQQQLRNLALGDTGLTIQGVYQCDSGLWHLETPTSVAPGPNFLVLPPAPRPVPRADAPGYGDYVADVGLALLEAIRQQGAGLTLPPRAELRDRYQVSRKSTTRLLTVLAELGWLTPTDDRHITSVPHADAQSTED